MEHVMEWISTYGYFAFFPLAVIEGPIITIIGGFLVRLGAFNPFIIYAIVVLGDMTGDGLYYAIGHFGKNKFLSWIGRHVGITDDSLKKMREHFDAHGWKSIIATKLTQGIGPVGLVAAGSAGMPYRRFMGMCLAVSLAQSAIFLGAGYFFGHAYERISRYLDAFSTGAIVLALFAGFLYFIHRLRKSA